MCALSCVGLVWVLIIAATKTFILLLAACILRGGFRPLSLKNGHARGAFKLLLKNPNAVLCAFNLHVHLQWCEACDRAL